MAVLSIDGVRLVADGCMVCKDHAEKAGGFEPKTRGVMRGLIPKITPGEQFIDVGAYTGFYSLLAARLNPECHVLAFEPSDAPRTRFVANVGINRAECITIRPQAIGGHTARVGIEARFPLSSAARVVCGDALDQTTLDVAVCDYERRVALVKIDVEGGEVEVILGGLDFIAQDRPIIVIEATEASICEVERHLRPFGYAHPVLLDRHTENQNYLLVSK